jgi:hypothetical protein
MIGSLGSDVFAPGRPSAVCRSGSMACVSICHLGACGASCACFHHGSAHSPGNRSTRLAGATAADLTHAGVLLHGPAPGHATPGHARTVAVERPSPAAIAACRTACRVSLQRLIRTTRLPRRTAMASPPHKGVGSAELQVFSGRTLWPVAGAGLGRLSAPRRDRGHAGHGLNANASLPSAGRRRARVCGRRNLSACNLLIADVFGCLNVSRVA